jgi:hypothetical protein
MAVPGKLSMWRTIYIGYQLAVDAVVGLRGATLVAIVLQLLVQIPQSLTPPEQPVLAAGRMVLGALAGAVALSPYAVLMHRRILLGSDDRNYWQAIFAPRTLRFATVAIGVDFLMGIGLGLMVAAGAAPPPGPQAALALAGVAWLIAWLVLFCRVFLSFPAIAVDGASSPVADSTRLTRGSGWLIFWIIVFSGVPLGLVGLGFAQVPTVLFGPPETGLVSRALGQLFEAILGISQVALLVAISSHLYRTRSAWSEAQQRSA